MRTRGSSWLYVLYCSRYLITSHIEHDQKVRQHTRVSSYESAAVFAPVSLGHTIKCWVECGVECGVVEWSLEWSVEWSQKWSGQWNVEWSVDQMIALAVLHWIAFWRPLRSIVMTLNRMSYWMHRVMRYRNWHQNSIQYFYLHRFWTNSRTTWFNITEKFPSSQI